MSNNLLSDYNQYAFSVALKQIRSSEKRILYAVKVCETALDDDAWTHNKKVNMQVLQTVQASFHIFQLENMGNAPNDRRVCLLSSKFASKLLGERSRLWVDKSGSPGNIADFLIREVGIACSGKCSDPDDAFRTFIREMKKAHARLFRDGVRFMCSEREMRLLNTVDEVVKKATPSRGVIGCDRTLRRLAPFLLKNTKHPVHQKVLKQLANAYVRDCGGVEIARALSAQ